MVFVLKFKTTFFPHPEGMSKFYDFVIFCKTEDLPENH